MKKLLLACILALLSGCTNSHAQPKLPYNAWFVGVFAPEHMEIWVESVDVIDRRGLAYERVSGGIPSYSGKVSGWPEHPAGGAGKDLPGIDLPEIIFVRWQSLVEPQTYNVRINIPEWVREEMLKPQRGYCHFQGKWLDRQFRKDITIGLAPGGVAKAWVGGPCVRSIEIGRFHAAISKVGPYGGKSDGHYYFISDEAKAYVEQHGVPYGSW
ncbi:hypothetical protein C1170_04005 [Stutzerimonas frequens]|uniref:DUF2931 family protein n=1 Tax=Stutzerimonas frequens TaxID=2968969 RepID=A0ABX6XX03_9GAMM|nr:DUF2931 family protein [Stutzerimonas frequens]MCQ4304561.1 DUF2931 family protein [Stutzerimonas frequens]PNF52108.1 hypothetical protein C1170_04005 [Stutzerimonas frequens]QPT18591.1 DUF2931 family protein [Stutzerimonas frequens]